MVSNVPPTYEELLRNAGAPPTFNACAPSAFSQDYGGTSSVPATYEDLLQGAGMASTSSPVANVGVTDHLARLEQELASMNALGGMRALSPTPPMPLSPGSQTYGGQQDILAAYNQLLLSHAELVKAHTTVVTGQHEQATDVTRGLGPPTQREGAGRIGILRTDGPLYCAPGTKTGTQGNKVFYQRVEGYSLEVCTAGVQDAAAETPIFVKEGVVQIKGRAREDKHLFVPSCRASPWNAVRPRRPTRTEPWLDESGNDIGVQYIYDSATILNNLREALELLKEECNVYCISGACSFMADIQRFCVDNTKLPCLMSSLQLLPMVDMQTPRDSYIMIVTANSATFSEKYNSLINSNWGIAKDERILLVGLQDTSAFGAEASAGEIISCDQAAESIVAVVRKAIEDAQPKRVLAILAECTEMPGYTNALRQSFECPVYDSITMCNISINAMAPRENYSDNTYS